MGPESSLTFSKQLATCPNPVHALASYFYGPFYMFLLSASRSPKWSFSFLVPTQEVTRRHVPENNAFTRKNKLCCSFSR